MNEVPARKSSNRILNGDTVTRRRTPAIAGEPQQAAGQSTGGVLPFIRCNCPANDPNYNGGGSNSGYYFNDCS